MHNISTDAIVVGTGAIGAAVAWRCAQRGLSVTTVDPDPARGAWHTAAGMLAPITELHYAEMPLLRLNLDSLARYPSFTAELSDATGLPTGYAECGTVEVAWDGADLATLRDLHAFGTGLGLKSSLLTGRELRSLEPALAAGLPGGLLAESDHQVDPRLLHTALRVAAGALGVRTMVGSASVDVQGDRAVGVVLADGTRLGADTVVLAAGAWSQQVAGLPAELAPPVRPVKGQTLRLRLPGPPRMAHVVRGSVKGVPVYVLPRSNGEYVVGASSEEAGFDQAPRAGAVYELLRDAQSLLPELGEAVLAEVCTGLRPGSPDNAPLLGPSGLDGLVYATGHFRNGILLSPVTADGVAELITTGTLPEVLAPFAPSRFAKATT
ncbi:MAG TPA: glycine oxidase ThiO [Jatrophihabitantaceae bacterium]|jgi:glycine oxidase|nr:glycine oxidase ThiO [Jatrophihabitantaceae bacterium]